MMREVGILGDIHCAQYTVKINNQLVPSSRSNFVYSFMSAATDHGSYNVKIRVEQGSITLRSSLAVYPAWINGSLSRISLPQPLPTPLYIRENNKLDPLCFPITINAGENFEVEHVVMNGPDYWQITVDDTCTFTDCLYIGDLYKEEYISELRDKKAVYNYQRQPNDIHNPAHLEMLLEKISSAW